MLPLDYIMYRIYYVMSVLLYFNHLNGFKERLFLVKRKIKNNVRFLRRSKDITQEELALRIGVHRQSVISIEKEKYEPKISVALALSVVLGEPVENIFYFKGEKSS